MRNTKNKRDSAETIYLLRYWREEDDSPRFLLETVGNQRRQLFTDLLAVMNQISSNCLASAEIDRPTQSKETN